MRQERKLMVNMGKNKVTRLSLMRKWEVPIGRLKPKELEEVTDFEYLDHLVLPDDGAE